MDWINKISMDDLDDDQKFLAETIGMQSYINLIKTYGGTYIYIQKAESYERKVRNEEIKKEFNGYNYKMLAMKYGLTEIQIRSIVKDIAEEKRHAPAPEQISIFD